MKHPEGIEGLEGRPPYGAVITKGRKAPGRRGVIETDRFHIVSPFENAEHIRPYLPRFAAWNTNKNPEARRQLTGMLVYPREKQSFTHRLAMPSFPKGYPPPHTRRMMIPVCQGDGKRAIRWAQDAGDPSKELNIKCPNERCEFRLTDPPFCKPYAKLSFMLQWDKADMPTPLCFIDTRSKGSARNMLGFFEYLDGIAHDLEIPDPNWMGLRFSLQLVQKTNPEKGRKWWEVVLSPISDIGEFLARQHEQLRKLAEPIPAMAIPDLREEDDGEVYEDIQSVEVGK